MKFWDTSAVIPLLAKETTSREMVGLLAEDRQVAVWWGTETECVSAIARLEREDALTTAETTALLRRLDSMRDAWQEVQPVASLRVTARRLLRVHALRAADALQLAAAIAAAEQEPSALELVCLDERLRQAAQKEGFRVLPVGGEGA